MSIKKYLPILIVSLLLIASRANGAMSTFVGSFSEPTSTGNQSVTGLGFQPKAIIFYMNEMNADGVGANEPLGMGFAVSSTSRQSMAGNVTDGLGSGNAGSYAQSQTSTIQLICGSCSGQTMYGIADFVSMDSNGFTLNWTNVTSTSRIVNYLALGGSDITNMATGNLYEPAATGTQVISGVGFKPDFLMMMWNDCASNISTTTLPNYCLQNQYGWGFAATSTSQASIQADAFASGLNIYAYNVQSTQNIVTQTGGLSIANTSTLVSMDSDGFTLNWGLLTTRNYVQYLALKGGQYAVGSFNQPTATGTQSISSPGFKPSATIFSSWDSVASTSGKQGENISFGVAASSGQQSSLFMGLANISNYQIGGTVNASQNLDRSNVLNMMTYNHASPTTQATANFTSNDSTGFTLNWTAADATARQIIYASFGSSPVSSAISPVVALSKGALKLIKGTVSLP